MELAGSMYEYGTAGMVAFEVPSTADTHLGYLVFIGGLGDGFFPVHYVTDLADALTGKGYGVVQVLMRSSYGMYGTCTLADDVEDLDQLVATLMTRFRNENEDRIPQIILLGHSTGCQDIVTYLRDGKNKEFITSAVLQSPVSDREYMMTLPHADKVLSKAQSMVEAGQGQELLERSAWKVPITAERYASLAGKLTADDLFSSDLSDQELEQLYAHINIPSLWIWGTKDQYMPEHIDKRRLGERLEWAVKCDSECLFIEGGDHALTGKADQLVEEVSTFITKRAAMFNHPAAEEEGEDPNTETADAKEHARAREEGEGEGGRSPKRAKQSSDE